ncbi:glycoside hydrolase family 27 protein [Desulfosarcina sp.]|nr:glycoside hydrolase family 27 protein [Desulfosarcina sp.]
MRLIVLITICSLVGLTSNSQTNNSLAHTPPMGWNSWNLFEGDVSEDLLKEIADAMVETGMKDAGYEYIIIDDIWQGGRDNRNNIIPDPEKFPNGIKALADYIHSKGLKLGIYSTAAQLTCAGYTASYGFEEQDAKTFAEWGVDYLKYDYCNAPGDMQTAMERYKTMSDALENTERPIVFAICEWGDRKPWLWGNEAGGHLWRTTWDSRDIWETETYDSGHAGIMNILDKQVGLESYAGPGGWNDPDLLMVGLYGKGKSSSWDGSQGCNDVEYKSHFSLWCMLAAPLIVNLDVRNMNEATKEILLNKKMIAIDQDPLGKQGFKFIDEGDFEIWVKELSNEEIAICYLNRSEEKIKKKIKIDSIIERFGYRSKSYKASDVWNPENIKKGKFPKKIYIESHGVVVFKLTKY